MSYYFSKTIHNIPFEKAIEKTTAALKDQGFGVLTEIDIKNTMKQKLDVEYNNYMILGACNPTFAHKALQAENKIGTMLPCNVIVRQNDDQSIEVAAVDPVASMMGVTNHDLADIAGEVRNKLKSAIDNLQT